MFWAIRSHTTATDLGAARGGSQFSRQSPLKNSQAQAPEDFGRRLKTPTGPREFLLQPLIAANTDARKPFASRRSERDTPEGQGIG